MYVYTHMYLLYVRTYVPIVCTYTDDVKTENTSLKVVIDSLNHEKEIDIRRMEELIEQSSRLELENSAL